MKFKIIDHTDKDTIEEMYKSTPVFVLTTGRSGSKFIANIFKELYKDEIDAYHEPYPVLENFPNYFYNNQNKIEELSSIFKTARMELILKSFIAEKLYFESNQCLNFLAHAIIRVFPNAKFVHLIRNPIDFTISAIKKGWYVNDSIWEDGRIKHKNSDKWNSMTQLEKLAWYWSENNRHIEDFKSILKPEQIFTIKFEDLISDEESLAELVNFSGIPYRSININDLKNIQKKKINELTVDTDEPNNMKKVTYYPKYHNWKDDDRRLFIKYVDELSSVYHYSLEKEINELEQKQKVIEEKNRELLEKEKIIKQMISEKDEFKKMIEEKNFELKQMQKVIDQKYFETKQFKKLIEQKDSELKQMQKVIDQNDFEVRRRLNEIEQMHSEKSQLKNQIVKRDFELQKRQKAIEEKHFELLHLKNVIEKLSKELSSIYLELDQKNRNCSELKIKLNEQGKIIDKLTLELSSIYLSKKHRLTNMMATPYILAKRIIRRQ